MLQTTESCRQRKTNNAVVRVVVGIQKVVLRGVPVQHDIPVQCGRIMSIDSL